MGLCFTLGYFLCVFYVGMYNGGEALAGYNFGFFLFFYA